MGNGKSPDANLPEPTIPDVEDAEREERDTQVDHVVARTEVTAVMGYGPTIPSFRVPGLPDDVKLAEKSTPSVDEMITDSLHSAVIPQPPTLSSILRTPVYAPTETPLAPLGSLEDPMPQDDASPEEAGAVRGGRSRIAVVLIVLGLLAAAAVAAALFFRPHVR